MVSKQRDKTIDIAKGICIILMVVGHSGSPLTHFIYLFHMACFFIISGYCYKDNYHSSINGIASLIKARLKTLYMPYVIINVAYILLNNFFLKIGFVTNDETFLEIAEKGAPNVLVKSLSTEQIIRKIVSVCLFIGESNFAGSATWFLRVLFVVNISFAILMFILKKFRSHDIIAFIVSLLMLFMSWYISTLGVTNFANIITVGETLVMFNVGYLLRTKLLLKNTKTLKVTLLLASILILDFGSFFTRNNIEPVSLATPYITNPVFYILMSIAGFILIKITSELACYIEFLARILEKIGQHTIVILALHFVAFKIVTQFIIKMESKPQILLASYPVIYFRETSGAWWILYSFVGVVIPLVLVCLSTNIKFLFKCMKMEK